MKKIILASSLIVLGMSSAFAADGTITINGKVTASTCVINSDNPDFVVTLPTVSTTVLADTATAGRTPFTINLTGCTEATNVATYFEPGSTVDFATGRLNNTTTGGAANVQVQLLGSNNAVIPVLAGAGAGVTQTNSQVVATDGNGAAALNYYAEYYANGVVGAGAVNTSVQYTVIYP